MGVFRDSRSIGPPGSAGCFPAPEDTNSTLQEIFTRRMRVSGLTHEPSWVSFSQLPSNPRQGDNSSPPGASSFLFLSCTCSWAFTLTALWPRAGSKGLVAANCGEDQGAAEARSAPERAAGLGQHRRGGACPRLAVAGSGWRPGKAPSFCTSQRGSSLFL